MADEIVGIDDEEIEGQFVLVHFYGFDKTRISEYCAMMKQIRELVDEAGVGELYRTDFPVDGKEGYFCLNGPDAQKIVDIILPSFLYSNLLKGAEISLLYELLDDEDWKEEIIQLV